jgi:hypothetical protein
MLLVFHVRLYRDIKFEYSSDAAELQFNKKGARLGMRIIKQVFSHFSRQFQAMLLGDMSS